MYLDCAALHNFDIGWYISREEASMEKLTVKDGLRCLPIYNGLEVLPSLNIIML